MYALCVIVVFFTASVFSLVSLSTCMQALVGGPGTCIGQKVGGFFCTSFSGLPKYIQFLSTSVLLLPFLYQCLFEVFFLVFPPPPPPLGLQDAVNMVVLCAFVF